MTWGLMFVALCAGILFYQAVKHRSLFIMLCAGILIGSLLMIRIQTEPVQIEKNCIPGKRWRI